MKFLKLSKKIASSILVVAPMPFILTSCYSTVNEDNLDHSEDASVSSAIEVQVSKLKEKIVEIRTQINEEIQNYKSINDSWDSKEKERQNILSQISDIESQLRLSKSKYETLQSYLKTEIDKLEKDSSFKANSAAKELLKIIKANIDLTEEDYATINNPSLAKKVKSVYELSAQVRDSRRNIALKEGELQTLKEAYNKTEDSIVLDYYNLSNIWINTVKNINEIRRKELALKTLNNQSALSDKDSNAFVLQLRNLDPLPTLPGDISPSQPIEVPEIPPIVNPIDPGNEPEDGRPMEVPEVPEIPINFPWLQDWSEFNKYPSEEFMVKFETLKSQARKDWMYEEIWKRTFSFKYKIQEKEGSMPFEPVTGTSWIIDYHKYTNAPNKYKIFMATNLHVLEFFGNAGEKAADLNYQDPAGFKVVDFALGRTERQPEWNDIPNNSWRDNVSKKGSNVIFRYGSSSGISAPKLVYAAIDFINDPQAYNGLNLEKQKQDFYNQIKGLKTEVGMDAYNNARSYAEKLTKIPYYSDFGIFEFDVDLNAPNMDQTLKSWLTDAIFALEEYDGRKTLTSPNRKYDDIPFLVVDYISTWKDQLSQGYSEYTDVALSNAKDVYIAGYPVNIVPYWMQNNPTERNNENIDYFKSPKNKDAFAFSSNDYSSKMESGNPSLKCFWHRPFLDFYGLNYNIKFSSLYYGSSGSVVYNEFGQVVGIYSGVSQNASFGDLMKPGSFTPLIQATNIEFSNGKISYAYNLIDGSDKTKYPKQTNSYRENLRKLYPNGFSDGSKRTKIFDEF